MNIKFFVALTATLLLSACNTGWNLDALKKTEFSGTEFDKALAKEYLGFSESEAEQYDWTDSSYFAEKGMFAANGQTPEPENPESRKIDDNNLPALKEARGQLMEALGGENKTKNPEMLARAQMMYDCWVEQQEENWQVEHISACRDEFFDILNKLKTPSTAAPVPAVDNVQHEKSTFYTVNFNFDSWKLDAEAKAIIKTAAIDMQDKLVEVNVVSSGYTDAVGNEKYNLLLSKKRAEAVKRELVKNGFKTDNIKVMAHGENDPVIKTKKKERQNRRVEIIVKE